MIGNEAELRAVIGPAKPASLLKLAERLTPLSRQLIERSPFVCIATARPDGGLDVSPRGDPAGFVRILDDRTLLEASAVEGRVPRARGPLRPAGGLLLSRRKP